MSIYDECPVSGDYEEIDADFCDGCGRKTCQHYPDKVKERADRLERFKSSEFAADILKRASAVFGLSEEDAAKHLESAFKAMDRAADAVVQDVAKEYAQHYVCAQVSARANCFLDAVFNKAMEEKILVMQKDERALTVTIQEQVTNKVKSFLQDKTGDRYSKSNADPIQTCIEKIVSKKVDEAVKELVAETIEKFSKEAMKRMMEGMAKAIQDDKRLLTMMTE